MNKRLTTPTKSSRIATMTEEFVTIKIKVSSRRKLRRIAGLTEEQMYDVIDRLLQAEVERLEGDRMHTGGERETTPQK